MGERLLVTTYGAQLTEAVRAVLADVRGDDPLAPVDIVVPSATAGMTLRRELAQPGLANVRFSSFPQLAERLAARHLALTGRRPLTADERGDAVRAAVAGWTSGGRQQTLFAKSSTLALLTGVLVELEESETDLAALTPRTDAARAVTQLQPAYQRWLGDHLPGALPSPQVMDAAVDALTSGDAPETAVVLVAPRRVSSAEQRLLHALAERERLSVVLAVTGDDDVDAPTHRLCDQLEVVLESPRRNYQQPAAQPHLVLAPDAEEEVRLAVRRVLDHLAAAGAQPHRAAIAYRSPVPYARLLGEQLQVAGVPHHVPSRRTLADSVAGRTVLDLLALHHGDYARAAVLTWLADAPVLDRDGRLVPAARWDRLSREAGVARGIDGWRQRLGTLADAATARAADEAGADEAGAARHQRRDGDAHALLRQVEDVGTTCTRLATATTWPEVSGLLAEAVQRFLGGAAQVQRWGQETDADHWVDVERRAYDAVLSAVQQLATRPGTPTFDAVRAAVADELDRASRGGTTLGRGVTVGPVRDLVGADLDLLVVVGMTEDSYPPRTRQHPLLGDDDRAAASAALETTVDRRRAERRDHLAALACARKVVLSCPRADTRAQRAHHPSPWFLEVARRSEADPTLPSTVALQLQRDWFERHDSFVSSLAGATTPASGHELDVALAMAWRDADLRSADGRYKRGCGAVAARTAGEYGEWLGGIGALPESFEARVEARLSATALEAWATCPLSYFLRYGLHLAKLDDPGEQDVIDGRDRGSLVHEVLEQFIGDHVAADGRDPRNPDDAWTADELAHARGLLDVAAEQLEREGRAGRPLLWQAEKARLHRMLARALTVDSALRARRRSWPVAVEDAFGRHDQAPLVLDLHTAGEVRFAGSVDRVDATESGGLVVLDYKTGSGNGYDAIPKAGTPAADLVDRGRKLQLVLYALAARERHGEPTTPVESYYWFVEQGALHRGATVQPPEERRLLEVLDVSVAGIRSGVYPAHPGDWDAWNGHASCTYCPFDRVCPSGRGGTWDLVQHHPDVAGFTGLARTTDEEDATP